MKTKEQIERGIEFFEIAKECTTLGAMGVIVNKVAAETLAWVLDRKLDGIDRQGTYVMLEGVTSERLDMAEEAVATLSQITETINAINRKDRN